MTKFKDLSETILVNDDMKLVLEKSGKTKHRRGIRGLSDIWWFQYRIEMQSKLLGEMDRILIMPFLIDKEIQEEAMKEVINGGVAEEGVKRPHVDFKTGNIHPIITDNLDYDNSEIKQILLVRGSYNPKTGQNDKHCFPMVVENLIDEPCYEYTWEKKKIYVSKACYYPLIDNNDSKLLSECNKQKILKEIWGKIETLKC